MTEIQRLICFLESGRRKEISMTEYVSIQQRRQKWSERRCRQLLAELSRSQAIPPKYITQNGQVVRILKLRTA
ncbi:hypothetical protein ACKO6X_002826 [Enterococcus hirae]|uniref:hypothetical protein n=2 Tax=Enterococcus hirae TaxID=1354 RepID=UPI0009C11893|nr:hypothetical protein [Enterococcus hirae]EMF0511985.1 hypothetical protein [Enterococcus hirae]OQO43551.1 hypothetical protein BH737_12165 [Enterococcus hirae]